MNHAKIHQATLIGRIKSCYVDNNETIKKASLEISFEDFEQLQKGDDAVQFFYEKAIVGYAESAIQSNDKAKIEKAEKEFATLQKAFVVTNAGRVPIHFDSFDENGNLKDNALNKFFKLV